MSALEMPLDLVLLLLKFSVSDLVSYSSSQEPRACLRGLAHLEAGKGPGLRHERGVLPAQKSAGYGMGQEEHGLQNGISLGLISKVKG